MDRTLFPTPRTEHTGVFVRVAVERGLDRATLTYAAEPGTRVGERVEVPLGRGDTRTGGVVVAVGGDELLDGFDPARVKSLFKRTGSCLTPALVELATWMADYYVCPLGMVLSTMTPAAVKHSIGRRTVELIERPTPPAELPKLTPTAREAWARVAALDSSLFPADARDLMAMAGSKTIAPINRLVDAGLLVRTSREIVREARPMLSAGLTERSDAPTPTADQQRLIDGIAETLGTFAPHLIRGVTGSGKTEVYLRVIRRALDQGQSAIVLVPEIALTPQTSARFESRFREFGVAVLHSGLTATQRHHQWADAAEGRARVVVGARSAVFAPLSDLGVIVVDEEQDTSYKQDQLPRYHARAVAIKRAQLEGCPVVLGSATPALESWHNATRPNARFALWELDDRVGGGKLPRVEIADIAVERRMLARDLGSQAARDRAIGPRLEGATREALDRGGQVIYLLNRRGFAGYLCCTDSVCGWSVRCEHCDASMVLHQGKSLPRGSVVRCHHCQAEQLVPGTCGLCGKPLIRLSAGTQRLEDEIESLFALERGSDFLRIDSDTMASARDYFDALGRFARAEARLLVGTQMIAKGLDFPGVELVGVVNADSALALPDFRAAERTFQLVSQVAGRAGRGQRPGLVIVQTGDPGLGAIRHAAEHDYRAFADEEMRCRRDAHLPPFARMARVVCRDTDAQRAHDAATSIGESLRAAAPPRVEIIGPAPCAIGRIAGQFRIEVQVSAPDAGTLRDTLNTLRSAGLLKSDAKTAVDVDPVSLL